MKKRGISRTLAATLCLFLVAPAHEAAQAAGIAYSFTTAGSTGVNGPTQALVNTAYMGTPLAGQVVIRIRGIQEWTIPASDTYSVTAAGASGGYAPGKLGGRGRVITSQIYLNQGQVLKILVGQEGGRGEFTAGAAGGGGGGTFIVDSATATPLLVVGGGGGGAKASAPWSNTSGSNGLDASPYNSTAGVDGTNGGAGGTNGGGGVTNGTWCAGGGGGFTGNGSNGLSYAYGGKSFTNGGAGGANYAPSNTINIAGGFGGGGGLLSMDGYETNGGGGGGYSGGGCGRNANHPGGGGGGGNFYTGRYISNSLNTGDGYVTITRLTLDPATISIFSASRTAVRQSPTAITATANTSGLITFTVSGKRITGCIRIRTSVSGSNHSATCAWKPTTRGSASILAVITPFDIYGIGTSNLLNIGITGRSGNR